MNLLNLLTGVFLAIGVFFFVAGTFGLLRFPDLYSRLHALTKADNAGLGFTVLALMLQAGDWTEVMKLGLIWVMVLVASATACFLIGNEALRRGQPAWTGRPADAHLQVQARRGVPDAAPVGGGEPQPKTGGAV